MILRTLDRYIIRQVVPPAIVALLVFTFTLEVQPITNIAEPLIRRGVDWTVTLRIMALTIPQALALTIPMALLCGVLIATGRLSADSEFRVMQACGLSIVNLLRPILLLGAAFGLVSAYVGFLVAPAATTAFRTLAFSALTSAGGEIRPRTFVNAFPNQTIFFRDVAGGVWQDVFIADSSASRRPVVYVARQGRLNIDRERRTLSIVLTDGTAHVTPLETRNVYEYSTFRESVMYLDWEAVFPSASLAETPGEMSLAELREGIRHREALGRTAPEFSVELHRRYFVPAACLVLAVLGFAVGASISTTGKFGSFLIGLVIVFLCYVMMFAGRAMVIAGYAPAWIAVWYPIGVLGLAAIAMIAWRMRGGVAPTFSVRGRTRRTSGKVAIGDRLTIRAGRFRGWFKARTLDLYVVRLYLAVWALTYAGLASLSYASLITELLADLFRSTSSAWLAVPYLAYQFPVVTYYVMPVATLLSALATIGLLTKRNEVAAMKACGISLYRIAAPLLVAAGAIGIVLIAVQERVMPESTRRAEAIREQIRGRPPLSFRQMNRTWVMGRTGSIYNFGAVHPQSRTLIGLSIFDFYPGEWRLHRRLSAATATACSTSGCSPYEWAATGTDIWSFQSAGTPSGARAFSSTRIRMEPMTYFKADRPEAERMSYFELSRYVSDLRSGGANVTPYLVSLYRKVSFPFVTIVMTLLAVPFAVTTGKTGAVHGIGIGALVAFSYWTVMSAFGALGSSGVMLPMLAAWAPNILFGVGAAYLMLRAPT